MLQSAASDQGLLCLQLIQQFLDTPSGSTMHLFKVLGQILIDCVGFNDTSTLVDHFVKLRKRGSREMKERNREERGTGMKVKKQKK